MMWPKNVLMVRPTYFDVVYAINEHMKGKDGELNRVDKDLAMTQWESLQRQFSSLGLNVIEISPGEGLPDMVFCANQTLPYGDNQFILSKMHSPFRAQETLLFKNQLMNRGYKVVEYQYEGSFEGMGDALWNYETGELFGGYGHRTQGEVYDELEEVLGVKVHRLELVSKLFYHLDTCLAIAGKDCAFAVMDAFNHEGQALLKDKFKNLVEIPTAEAINFFAGNMCVVDGRNIVIQKGAKETCAAARELGFVIHEVETSEFMKSGGSVFCMKQLF